MKKDASSLRESIGYVKRTYGDGFLLPLIVSRSKSYLEEVLPYIDSRGELEVLKTSASILSLKMEEIKERESFISRIGEDNIKDGRFNSIYGLSKKKYLEKVKQYQSSGRVVR